VYKKAEVPKNVQQSMGIEYFLFAFGKAVFLFLPFAQLIF
jgi:hypothetical protein